MLKKILLPTLSLFIVCIVVAASLATTNMFTSKKIAALTEEANTKARMRILPSKQYEKQELSLNGKTYSYYVAYNDSEVIGYIFNTSANGYGGVISVLTGIDCNGKIIAVEVTDASNETAGLGQNTAKKAFYSQFAECDGKISVVKSSPQKNQIQAVTGATVSSKAATAAVNTALELYNQILTGGAK